MAKNRFLIFCIVVLAIVSLFATIPAFSMTACNPCTILSGIEVEFQGLTTLPNGNKLVAYDFFGSKITEVTSYDVMISKKISVVNIEDYPGLKVSDPCEGSLIGDATFGLGSCESIVIGNTATVNNGHAIFMFEIANAGVGPVGLDVEATRGRNAIVTTLGPVVTLGAAVSCPSEKRFEIDNVEYCVDIDPNTCCPDQDNPVIYLCSDSTKTPVAFRDNLTINSENAGGLLGPFHGAFGGGDPNCPMGVLRAGASSCSYLWFYGWPYGPLPVGCTP